jgi:hypothetical protein
MNIAVYSPDRKVRVQLSDYSNEGIEGPYIGEEDVLLLRFDVAIKNNGRWEELDDSSYCTQIPADTPREEVRRLARLILGEVRPDAMSILRNGHGSVRRLCEGLSWINATWGTPNEIRRYILDDMLEAKRQAKNPDRNKSEDPDEIK